MQNENYVYFDGDTVSFVEQKEWSCSDTADEVAKLHNFMITGSVLTTNGIYLILEEINQDRNPGEELHRLARFTVNEETCRVELDTMLVTQEQAKSFMLNCGEWE